MTQTAGLRWTACLFAAVFAHCLVAAALLGRHRMVVPPTFSVPIDLVPAAAAPPPPVRAPAPPLIHVAAPVAAAPTVLARPKPSVRRLRPPRPLAAGSPIVRPAAPIAPKTVSPATQPHLGPAPAPTRIVASASWATSVKRRIAGCLHYPARAARNHLQGTAVVRVRIAADGRVLAASIVSSSGANDLDREAIAVWSRASPLPPPPAGSPAWQVLSVAFELAE